MSSILTNHGAQIALRTLKTINGNLTDVQNSISTGKRIGSAKDNAAVWSIAKTMESDISGFRSIKDGLAMGEATVAVASAGAEQIVEKLTEIKELIVSAQSENVDHDTIQTDIASKVEQVEAIIAAAQFNGRKPPVCGRRWVRGHVAGRACLAEPCGVGRHRHRK